VDPAAALLGQVVALQVVPDGEGLGGGAGEERGVPVVGGVVALDEVAHVDGVLPRTWGESVPGALCHGLGGRRVGGVGRRGGRVGGRVGPGGGALLRAATLGGAQARDRGGRARPHIARPPRAGSARAPAAATRADERGPRGRSTSTGASRA